MTKIKAIEWALQKAREELRICGLVYRDQKVRDEWANDERLGLDNFISRRQAQARTLQALITEFEQMQSTASEGGV